jgi:hypothetical protein
MAVSADQVATAGLALTAQLAVAMAATVALQAVWATGAQQA